MLNLVEASGHINYAESAKFYDQQIAFMVTRSFHPRLSYVNLYSVYAPHNNFTKSDELMLLH